MTDNTPTQDKQQPTVEEEEEEDDPWDKRIKDTGCFEENTRLLICKADKRDWRLCREELEAFRRCYARRPPFKPQESTKPNNDKPF
jgi:cytochrome c oxidase assembly factor 4